MSAYPRPPYQGRDHSSTPGNPNLPARPPPSATGPRGFRPAFNSASPATGSNAAAPGTTGFTGFAPRAVASNQPYRPSNSAASAGPQPPPFYAAQPTYNQGFQGGYQHQQQQQQQQQQAYYGQSYQDSYAEPTPPQIRNPFAPPTANTSADSSGYGAQPKADPDMEAQIAQWQSAYTAKDDAKSGAKGPGQAGVAPGSGAPSTSAGGRQEADGKGGSSAGGGNGTDATGKPKTVQRAGGGQSWSDSTLLEWDPAHFRLFVGNLAGEVTDDSLLKAFARYPSIQKARVIRDKRTTKSRGYGFISFSDGDDYFKAARDMQGKYIGSHPVLIKKSTTEIKPVTQRDNLHGGKKGNKGSGKGGRGFQARSGNGGDNVLGPSAGGGVSKKHAKTKGGLKVLG